MQTALASTSLQPAPHPALLRGIPAAAPVQDTRLLGTTRALTREERIFAEGDHAAYFYKVVSGAVRTSKLLSDGRRQIDAFHMPGDIFGMETGDEHRFSAEALSSATVIMYRRSQLETLASGDTAFATQILHAMRRSLERAQEHMLLLGRKSAMEKIAAFLLDMAKRVSSDDHVDLPMLRIDIADHLGLTIETVSRSLTQLEREGIIELPSHRRTIVLRNKGALRHLDA